MIVLAKAGVPWEVASELSDALLLGFTVAVGEIEGQTFNWRTMSWESQR